LKDTEKRLLLDGGILSNYHNYMTTTDESLLSKFYGVFTIRIENMEDIHCFIMDNLLGRDFNNILRIYDLKGSRKGRKVPLSKK